MKKICLFLFMSICFASYGQNTTYYVDSRLPANGGGNNANNGTSPATAWKDIVKVQTIDFKAGDKILFYSSGPWHNGTLFFDANDVGTPTNPIVVGKYGPGERAPLYSTQEGLKSIVGNIRIENINFISSNMYVPPGSPLGDKAGIEFYRDGAATHAGNITINNCTVSHFNAKGGIWINSWNPDAARRRGWENIVIKKTTVDNCGETGIWIGTMTGADTTTHRNIMLDSVRTTENKGVLSNVNINTGSGIVVSAANNVVIQNSVADHNGANNRNPTGGPVGIWFYNVSNGIIQNCEAFNNFAGLALDGNGFGIDGGCRNCVIQYCYSHENEGAGYGLFEYGSTNTYTNNTVRYNISQNDGRKNGAGAIALWGVDDARRITNSNIYNNTIYMDANNLVDATKLPSGIKILTNNMSNVKVYNNIFHLASANADIAFTNVVNLNGAPQTIVTTRVLMLNNLYYKASNPKFRWGTATPFASLADWRTASNQEISGTTNFGFTTNPGLTAPGMGDTVAGRITGANPRIVPLGGNLASVTQYQLLANSSAINVGLRLNAAPYNLNIGSRDYYGRSLAGVSSFDLGAHQLSITSTKRKNSAQTLSIFPNPTSSTCQLSLTWPKAEIAKLQVINSLGQIVVSSQVALRANDNLVSVDQIAGLPAGLYTIQVSGSNNAVHNSIIKQ